MGSVDINETAMASVEGEGKPANHRIFKQFLEALNPVDMEDWRESKWFNKILMVCKAPVIFVLQLVIPKLDYAADRHGWTKLLNIIHLFTTPLLFAWAFEYCNYFSKSNFPRGVFSIFS